MIVPVEAETVDDYLSQLYSVTSQTRLDTIVPFYKKNKDIIRLVLNNLDELTPNYYIGKQKNLILGSHIICLSDILDIVGAKIRCSRIFQYVSEYLRKIYEIIKRDYNKDVKYLSDLCLVYSEIFSIPTQVLFQEIYVKYTRLSSQYEYRDRLIPNILEDVSVLILTTLATKYGDLNSR